MGRDTPGTVYTGDLAAEGFPMGPTSGLPREVLVVKTPPANAGGSDSSPVSGRFAGGRAQLAVNITCLENPQDRGHKRLRLRVTHWGTSKGDLSVQRLTSGSTAPWPSLPSTALWCCCTLLSLETHPGKRSTHEGRSTAWSVNFNCFHNLMEPEICFRQAHFQRSFLTKAYFSVTSKYLFVLLFEQVFLRNCLSYKTKKKKLWLWGFSQRSKKTRRTET